MCLSYSASFSQCDSNCLICLTFCFLAFFSSLSDAAGAFSREAFNSDIISVSMEGVNSVALFSMQAFSCATTSSICCRRIRIFSRSLARLRSTFLRHTKVYLLAFDSIFVPSTYSTSRLMNPLDARMRTICVNIPFISSLTRLRKRFIVR